MKSYKNLMGMILAAVFFAQGCASTGLYSCEARKTYYPDGELKSVWCYKNGKLNGIKREYRENGILLTVTQYKNNKLHGINHTYYPDGSLWTKEIYRNGSLTARIEYDEEGNVTSKENFF
jgi:antitoxin component YwqK of YwqJK toxin-antitoxin module